MPKLLRVLYATDEVLKVGLDLNTFDEIVRLEQIGHHHRPRFEAMRRCGLSSAIFIDGDTLFLDSTYELFEVLQHFDIGLCLAPHRFHSQAIQKQAYQLLPDVSTAIPEWNSGMIVCRLDDAFREFVNVWSDGLSKTINSSGYSMDQPALRSALCVSKLRIATLPNNYNYRAGFPQSVVGKVKILHAHGDLSAISKIVNCSYRNRYFGSELKKLCDVRPIREC